MFKPVKLAARHTEDGLISFTWGAVNTVGGTYTTAFRLKAGIYDSGWIEEDKSAYTVRLTAEAGDDVTWSVTLKDNAGNISEEGAAVFTYAHLKSFPGEWLQTAQDRESVPAVFEKTFTAEKTPSRALLFISAAGLYDLTLNGKTVGDEVLAPNLSHFAKRRFYRMYRLPVAAGENRLCVTLGDGWRRNHFGNWDDRQVTFFGTPEFKAFMRIEYSDAEAEILPTDGTWRCGKSRVTYSHLFNGEHCDLRLEESCSDIPVITWEFRPEPVYDCLPPVRETGRFAPRSVVRMEDGSYIIDFGQNLQGYVELDLPECEAGREVVLRHAEELDEDETLYTAVLRSAKATDRVITDGHRIKWKPRFTYHGFRYVQLSGWEDALLPEQLTAILISNDIQSRSSFESGSAILNAIQKNIVMTERSNLFGIATDCPQRDERLGWTNDTTVRFVETAYNFHIDSLFPKIIRDIIDDQGEDGAITGTAPLVFDTRPADPVCSSFLIAGLAHYLQTGDIETIHGSYQAFKSWNECLKAHSVGHIVDFSRVGDWAAPAYACVDNGAKSIVTDGKLMSTGYCYYNAKLLARFAGILGDEAEKEARLRDAEEIRAAFLERWFTREPLKIGSNSEGEIAFALWLDILPEETRANFAKILRDDLVLNDYRFTTGNLTTVYMLLELCRYGYCDEAYRMMTREEYPSYGFTNLAHINGITSLNEYSITAVIGRFHTVTRDRNNIIGSFCLRGVLDQYLFRCFCFMEVARSCRCRIIEEVDLQHEPWAFGKQRLHVCIRCQSDNPLPLYRVHQEHGIFVSYSTLQLWDVASWICSRSARRQIHRADRKGERAYRNRDCTT